MKSVVTFERKKFRGRSQGSFFVVVPTLWLESTKRIEFIHSAFVAADENQVTESWIRSYPDAALLVANITTKQPSSKIINQCDRIIAIGLAYSDAKLAEAA